MAAVVPPHGMQRAPRRPTGSRVLCLSESQVPLVRHVEPQAGARIGCSPAADGSIVIRRYRPADHAALRALHDRTPPAGQTTMAAQPWPPDLGRIPGAYRAFWVAVDAADPDEPLVGMLGVQPPGGDVPGAVMGGRADIVQRKRTQVAPERQRQGIGRQLLVVAVARARDHAYRAMILETTTTQAPVYGGASSLVWLLGCRRSL